MTFTATCNHVTVRSKQKGQEGKKRFFFTEKITVTYGHVSVPHFHLSSSPLFGFPHSHTIPLFPCLLPFLFCFQFFSHSLTKPVKRSQSPSLHLSNKPQTVNSIMLMS
jgi:hypothetical protein